MPTLRTSLIVLYSDISKQFKTNVKKNLEMWKRLRKNNAFLLMEVEKSSKLIAFFEAVMALLQIFFIVRKGHYAPNSPYFLWVPGERDNIDLNLLNKRTRLRTNFHFTIGLSLITILNSLLLYIGTVKVRIYLSNQILKHVFKTCFLKLLEILCLPLSLDLYNLVYIGYVQFE